MTSKVLSKAYIDGNATQGGRISLQIPADTSARKEAIATEPDTIIFHRLFIVAKTAVGRSDDVAGAPPAVEA